MSEPVISVKNVSKCYSLTRRTERYSTLRDSIAGLFRKQESGGRTQESFWALRDVTFDVRQGEVLGVIGRNGAGKSTLLKLLSRITEPTEGRITLRGRIASLLEVGTGFHPELTGRENIYLNGAILGMRRAEIAARFDEIVAFAEIEQFLDTPVKRYSSGMYVRLAFSVAAHLEPEILIVDEVLAVGDASFQRKCLGKMQSVSDSQGRTVLFVSHNMSAVTRLCQRAIYLDGGKIAMEGDTQTVTGHYLAMSSGGDAQKSWSHPDEAPGDDVARLKAVRVIQQGQVTDTIDIRLPVVFEMEYWCLKPDVSLMVAANFLNAEGVLLFVSADLRESCWHEPRAAGTYVSRCEVPGNLLAEGSVRIMAEVCTRKPVWKSHVREADVAGFTVVDSGQPGSVRAGWDRPLMGVMRPMLDWHTSKMSTQPLS